jgi:uncharacterized membrane protein YkvA (DUF1232 family)
VVATTNTTTLLMRNDITIPHDCNVFLKCGDQPNFAIIMAMKSIIRLGLAARIIQDLKLLIPLIRDYWKGTYRDVSAKSIIVFIVALAYIISPIDVIPDYILGLGQIDDAAILGLSLYFLEKDIMKYKDWKDREG